MIELQIWDSGLKKPLLRCHVNITCDIASE